MMGIFSKSINKEGAIAGMLAGIGITLLYVFQHKGIMFIQSTSFLGNMEPNWFLGIEPNAFGAIGAPIAPKAFGSIPKNQLGSIFPKKDVD